MTDKPNCHQCKHHRRIPGDAHIGCDHPEAHVIGLMAVITFAEASYKSGLAVKLSRHGVDQGWAMWPVNFDPIWLLECNRFEHG